MCVCLWMCAKKECNIASIYYPLGILNKPKTPCACDGVKNERITQRWRERERHRVKIENDENLWERKLFLIWKLFVHSREKQCAISGNGISHSNQWTSVLFFHRFHPRSFVCALSLFLAIARTRSCSHISSGRRWFRNWHTAEFCHFPNREVPHSHFNSFKILLGTITTAWSTFYSFYELFNSIKGVNSNWKTD